MENKLRFAQFGELRAMTFSKRSMWVIPLTPLRPAVRLEDGQIQIKIEPLSRWRELRQIPTPKRATEQLDGPLG
jgi:hypothetical protein